MSHNMRMLLGCLVPLALIFVLPALGVEGNVTAFVVIVLIFGCHMLMMGNHRHGGGRHNEPDKGGNHADH